MTLYLLKLHRQTFLSIRITQKYQILSCVTLVANERCDIFAWATENKISVYREMWQDRQCARKHNIQARWLYHCCGGKDSVYYLFWLLFLNPHYPEFNALAPYCVVDCGLVSLSLSLSLSCALSQKRYHVHKLFVGLIRRTACARAQFRGCSSTTNASSEMGQIAVCCQNLPLGALSSRSAPSLLFGELFKKFGLFLNTDLLFHNLCLIKVHTVRIGSTH